MPTTLEVESTLTDRYQTSVPELVRRCHRLGKRDKVHYSIRPNGEVVLSRGSVADETSDPLIGQFLVFWSRDIAEHPERLQALEGAFLQRLQSLTAGVEVDLVAKLSESSDQQGHRSGLSQ